MHKILILIILIIHLYIKIILRGIFNRLTFKNYLFNNCNFNLCHFYGCVFDSCQLINIDFTKADFLNVKFINCTMVYCIFSDSKMQDVVIEGGIKSECNFDNVQILDNVIGVTTNNIISENSDYKLIQVLKNNDSNNIIDFSDETEVIAKYGNVSLIFAEDFKEHNDNIWNVMVFINNESLILTTISDNECNTTYFINTLETLEIAAIKKFLEEEYKIYTNIEVIEIIQNIIDLFKQLNI